MAHFKKDKDHKKEWYWIFYADNGEAIARSSESYIREADCDHSISIVKAKAASAEIRKPAA